MIKIKIGKKSVEYRKVYVEFEDALFNPDSIGILFPKQFNVKLIDNRNGSYEKVNVKDGNWSENQKVRNIPAIKYENISGNTKTLAFENDKELEKFLNQITKEEL